MKFPNKKLLLTLLIALNVALFFGAPESAHAQSYLGDGWSQFLDGFLPTFQGAPDATGEELAIGVVRRAVQILKYVIGAIAVLFGIIYAMGFIFARGKEETLTKNKQNFLWILIGFVILMISDSVASIFNPDNSTATDLVDVGAARNQIADIVNYLKWLFSAAIGLIMTISAIRLMVSSGEEDVLTTQKRNLTWGGIGLLVILLADNLVSSIYLIRGGDAEVAAPDTAVAQIGSLIRLLLIFLGPLAVLFTIYAGFLYLSALNSDDNTTKAKQMIVAGITAIIIIYASFALVNTFLLAPLVPTTP